MILTESDLNALRAAMERQEEITLVVKVRFGSCFVRTVRASPPWGKSMIVHVRKQTGWLTQQQHFETLEDAMQYIK